MTQICFSVKSDIFIVGFLFFLETWNKVCLAILSDVTFMQDWTVYATALSSRISLSLFWSSNFPWGCSLPSPLYFFLSTSLSPHQIGPHYCSLIFPLFVFPAASLWFVVCSFDEILVTSLSFSILGTCSVSTHLYTSPLSISSKGAVSALSSLHFLFCPLASRAFPLSVLAPLWE